MARDNSTTVTAVRCMGCDRYVRTKAGELLAQGWSIVEGVDGTDVICPECNDTLVKETTSVLDFDRFMDDIVIDESRQRTRFVADTPQRRLMKEHREKPLNRTIVVRRTK